MGDGLVLRNQADECEDRPDGHLLGTSAFIVEP